MSNGKETQCCDFSKSTQHYSMSSYDFGNIVLKTKFRIRFLVCSYVYMIMVILCYSSYFCCRCYFVAVVVLADDYIVLVRMVVRQGMRYAIRP